MKSYTDKEQSKKLAEILPIESADMWYDRCGTPSFIDKYVTHESIKSNKYHDIIPCWSLASLIGVLPKYEIHGNGKTITLDVNLEALETEGDETLLDLVVNMIIHLHEQNLL